MKESHCSISAILLLTFLDEITSIRRGERDEANSARNAVR